jgi:hypothetical protein
MEVYREGAQMEDFAWDRQDSYMRAFETDPSAEPVRAFARGLFGEAWANHVLFDGPAPDGGQSPDPDPEMQGPDPDPEPGSDPQDPAPDPDPGSEPETPGDGNDAQSPDMSDAGEGGQNEGWVEDDAQTPNRGVGFRDDARPPVRSCQQAGQAAPATAWWPLLFVAFVAVRRQWVLR